MISHVYEDERGWQYKVFGDTFENEAIEGIYFSIYFAKVESVKAVIKHLERIKDLMERDNQDG